jgi:hypothetical protein
LRVPLRPLRFKILPHSRIRSKPLTAKNAKETRQGRKEISKN